MQIDKIRYEGRIEVEKLFEKYQRDFILSVLREKNIIAEWNVKDIFVAFNTDGKAPENVLEIIEEYVKGLIHQMEFMEKYIDLNSHKLEGIKLKR